MFNAQQAVVLVTSQQVCLVGSEKKLEEKSLEIAEGNLVTEVNAVLSKENREKRLETDHFQAYQ
ncbi:hypothetical protein ABIE66_001066 [Peribacillus sp. B2I2]|uniref:hypothetical protein n=1 Tax=Peribacillus sp. B2I2 TaxID=3156468 RepID=UPI00351912AF